MNTLDIKPEDQAAVAALLERLRAREARKQEAEQRRADRAGGRDAVKAAVAAERETRIAYWQKLASNKGAPAAVAKYASRRVAFLKSRTAKDES